MFKGTTDEPCTSSLQTRASHGTKMLSAEALAEEFGRKEWKHFMPDTGMAFRSGTVPVWGSAAIPSSVVFNPEPVTSRHRAVLRGGLPPFHPSSQHPAGQDAQDRSCGFIETVISHVCLVFLWQLVLFYLTFLLIHLLLVLE